MADRFVNYRQALTRSYDDHGEFLKVSDVTRFGEYDRIDVTYPTGTQEVYTYSLAGVDIGNITVNYTTVSKDVLSSVVYNEL